MAKRIKVTGKTPRGLSKATRQIDASQEALDRSGVHMSVRSPRSSDAELAKIAGLGGGITKPSSTRKKLVKEGNRKFIGPRQLKSEVREDAITRSRDDAGPDDYGTTQDRYRGVRKGDRRLFHDSDPSYGRGGIAKNPRLKELLMRLLDRHLGGGQEFDRDFPEVEY